MHVGFYTLIIMAGPQGIDSSYYEAASIDGATAWQRFRHITVPLLRPTALVVVILSMIAGFQAFDFIYTLTRRRPARRDHADGAVHLRARVHRADPVRARRGRLGRAVLHDLRAHHAQLPVRAPAGVDDGAARPPALLPQSVNLDNYTEALSRFDFEVYLRNSTLVTGGAAALTLVINAMAAYALAQSQDLYTLPVALAQFNSQEVVPFNYILAMSVVSMVPVAIVFPVLQRHIVKGIAQTGFR